MHGIMLRSPCGGLCPTPMADQRLAPPAQSWRPFSFRVVYTLRGMTRRWNYPRTEWHRLTHFVARLGVWESLPEGYRWPTICDMVLSFLALNGGKRFLDGMPGQWHGGSIATQIETFTYAVRIFQELTGRTAVVPAPNAKVETCKEAAKQGMPDFKLLLLPVKFPNPENICDLFGQGVRCVAEARELYPDLPHGWWRRWYPGDHASQLVDCGNLPPKPLVVGVPKRLARSAPEWMHQVHDFHAWWKSARSGIHFRCELPYGGCIGETLENWGVLSRADIKGFQVQQRRTAVRAASLLQHNKGAAAKQQHLAPSAVYFRPQCAACHLTGPLGNKVSWFQGKCLGVHLLDAKAIADA